MTVPIQKQIDTTGLAGPGTSYEQQAADLQQWFESQPEWIAAQALGDMRREVAEQLSEE